ncbi:hypothetical protein K402DRAFT_427576, partial [Aulographum hederae CBS 113979]
MRKNSHVLSTTSFQDAVVATRKLGVRYLWIDSLCIIQDSKEDWENESVKMCEIYQHALLTITSAHSSNAFGGLIARRDAILTVPFEIEFPFPSGVRRCLFSPMPRREVVWDTSELPLYKRGWCLQELVLSARAVIFDPDGLRWSALPSSAQSGALRNGIASHNMDHELFDAFGESTQGRSIGWHHIVEDYTKRSLTKESDRLIAIAGIAEAMQKRSRNAYYAGLWENYTHLQLLWYVRHYREPPPTNFSIVHEPPPYRSEVVIAPSWSWASV